MTDTLGPLLSFQPPVTPALVVRRATLEANLATMQAACSAAGVGLRAHGKMHKCTTLGRRQVELGRWDCAARRSARRRPMRPRA